MDVIVVRTSGQIDRDPGLLCYASMQLTNAPCQSQAAAAMSVHIRIDTIKACDFSHAWYFPYLHLPFLDASGCSSVQNPCRNAWNHLDWPSLWCRAWRYRRFRTCLPKVGCLFIEAVQLGCRHQCNIPSNSGELWLVTKHNESEAVIKIRDPRGCSHNVAAFAAAARGMSSCRSEIHAIPDCISPACVARQAFVERASHRKLNRQGLCRGRAQFSFCLRTLAAWASCRAAAGKG